MKTLLVLACFLFPAAATGQVSPLVNDGKCVSPCTHLDPRIGQLSPQWTIVRRHGEYGQSETECNIANQVSVYNNQLHIRVAVQNWSCGDWNTDGSVKTAPATWSYITGDVQWTPPFSFTYGTVTIRGRLPAKASQTWPSWWFMDSVCQIQNIYSGDPTGTCPTFGTSTYREMDMIECEAPQGGWCNFTMHNGTNNPTCQWNTDTNYHTWTMTWSPGAASLLIDGASSGCSYSGANVPSGALFGLIQIQTSPDPGPPVNANLPEDMVTTLYIVQDSMGNVIFYDDFTTPLAPNQLRPLAKAARLMGGAVTPGAVTTPCASCFAKLETP